MLSKTDTKRLTAAIKTIRELNDRAFRKAMQPERSNDDLVATKEIHAGVVLNCDVIQTSFAAYNADDISDAVRMHRVVDEEPKER